MDEIECFLEKSDLNSWIMTKSDTYLIFKKLSLPTLFVTIKSNKYIAITNNDLFETIGTFNNSSELLKIIKDVMVKIEKCGNI